MKLVADLAYTAAQSQNLLLGPDCEKYLEAYPKAPPGIEKWVTYHSSQMTHTHSSAFPTTTDDDIKYDIRLTAALSLTLMLDQRSLRAILVSEYFTLGFLRAVRLMPARQRGLFCIFTWVLLVHIFVWVVDPVSEFLGPGTAAGLVYLFFIVSSLTRRLGFDKAFIVTAT